MPSEAVTGLFQLLLKEAAFFTLVTTRGEAATAVAIAMTGVLSGTLLIAGGGGGVPK